ncbi:VOC family protein [Mesorhizobium retamae]|uniref:VOC family protein n=1 Tax=Mesorhizobium retamae TaxID=2912854 RepID=A0ABS9Q7P5_9HYPH|nr:VOC family protein [Mesorhizobium sp. IRAMC:0171]MCG7503431.1 VOC family protein [Mesorhizobium sp. IRAMC:0171]
MATVRYFAGDVDASVLFYTRHLGFALRQQFGPNMAILDRGDLTLWLAGHQASASRPMPDGAIPEPGGWNRFVLEVTDLPSFVTALQDEGVSFRNTMIEGPGGRQILCMDPSGNVIELFEAAAS